MDLVLVTIAKNDLDMLSFDAKLDAMLLEDDCCFVSIPITNYSKRSLASIANEHLETVGLGYSVFGLCHADMEFQPGSLQAFYDCAASGAVCGACGRSQTIRRDPEAGPGDSSYVWSYQWGAPTPRQQAAGWPLNPWGPCPVSTLDSSCIFFPTNLGLRFDEQTFDGFHLHGEDICLQAHAKGIPVLVPAANAWHACQDTNGPGWGAERDRYKVKLDAKWKGRFPDYVTT